MSSFRLFSRRRRTTRLRVIAWSVAGAMTALSVPSRVPLSAQGTPTPINYAAGDVIPAHDSLTVASRAVGESRRINVFVPRDYAQSGSTKYPVLYMPDGGIDEDFPHVVNTIDSLVRLKLIRPIIVVGIPNTERRRDMTGPTTVGSDSAIAKRVGGSAAFRAFIRDELIPEINKRYRTTSERSIVGESLAGLFVVETLVIEPSLFTHYIAFDASLWWNKQSLAANAPAHLKSFGNVERSLYHASSSEDIDDSRARFTTMLRASAPKSLSWSFVPRTDLKHATIFRAEAPAAFRKMLK